MTLKLDYENLRPLDVPVSLISRLVYLTAEISALLGCPPDLSDWYGDYVSWERVILGFRETDCGLYVAFDIDEDSITEHETALLSELRKRCDKLGVPVRESFPGAA